MGNTDNMANTGNSGNMHEKSFIEHFMPRILPLQNSTSPYSIYYYNTAFNTIPVSLPIQKSQ